MEALLAAQRLGFQVKPAVEATVRSSSLTTTWCRGQRHCCGLVRSIVQVTPPARSRGPRPDTVPAPLRNIRLLEFLEKREEVIQEIPGQPGCFPISKLGNRGTTGLTGNFLRCFDNVVQGFAADLFFDL